LIKDADHEDPSFLGRLQWLHISRRDWRRLRISAAWEILSSAGTYGDVSRHLQVLPGVVGVSDLSDGVLVRTPASIESFTQATRRHTGAIVCKAWDFSLDSWHPS
jgi:hypothetical protein